MIHCCSQKLYQYIVQCSWFIISAIGHPAYFLLTFPLPKDILAYHVNTSNIMKLHIIPFIILALTAKTIWYILLICIAYLRGNKIRTFLHAYIVPRSTQRFLGQLILLSLGYTNLYKMTITGMDSTIVGMVYFLLIIIASVISGLFALHTIYQLLRKRYA